MAKKIINSKKNKLENVKKKSMLPKKFSLEITSKMKKKLKLTKYKLNVEKIKIDKIISHIIKEQPFKDKVTNDNKEEMTNNNMNEIILEEENVPIYLYITFKKDLKEEEKKYIKNRLLKLKYSMVNDIIYICLIEEQLSEEEIEELKEITGSKIDIITKDDLKNNIKSIKSINLENHYQIFISNMRNSIYLNKNFDILLYNDNKFDIIKNLVQKVYKGATIVKLLNKKDNIIKMKFGYNNMKKSKITDNAFRLIYKVIPFILSKSEKFNGVENIIIKTNKSIPFIVFGNINPENINYYNQ